MQTNQYFSRNVDVEALYTAADVDGDGFIGLQDASAFFAGALLPPTSMNSIWGACSTAVSLPIGPNGACTAITRATFMQALLLISASQQGVFPLTPAVAIAAAPLAPPAFIALSHADCAQYETVFASMHQQRVPPSECAKVFSKWGATPATLNAVWALSDLDHDNALSQSEFIIAMTLLAHASRGMPLPSAVPATVLCSIPGMHSAQRSPSTQPQMQPQMQHQQQQQQQQQQPMVQPASPMHSMTSMRVGHRPSSSLSISSTTSSFASQYSGPSSPRAPTGFGDSLLSSGSSGVSSNGGDNLVELERQLQEARMATSQLRAAQKNATTATTELVLQRTEAENTLRTLQEELATLTKAIQAEDNAVAQTMGMVRDASNNVTAAQTMQQQLQEQQMKQAERMQIARTRAEELTNEITQMRAEAQRLAAETEALQQKANERKAQEAALGNLTDIFLKQMAGKNIDADSVLCDVA